MTKGKATFQKIDNNKKIFQEILKQLIEQLQQGTLHAGDKLPAERALAASLGVSRPAVRESIRALEVLGLIRSIQGDGNYLADDLDNCLIRPLSLMFSLSQSQIAQAQELRTGLEMQTAVLAARKCTPANAAALMSILNRINNSDDRKERGELDRELHYKIAEIADNQLILSVLHASSNLIDNIIIGMRTRLMADEDFDKQHQILVKAISSHNESLALRAMQTHMKSIAEKIEVFQDYVRTQGL